MYLVVSSILSLSCVIYLLIRMINKTINEKMELVRDDSVLTAHAIRSMRSEIKESILELQDMIQKNNEQKLVALLPQKSLPSNRRARTEEEKRLASEKRKLWWEQKKAREKTSSVPEQ